MGLRRLWGERSAGAYARSSKGEHIAPGERPYLREVGEGVAGRIGEGDVIIVARRLADGVD